MKKMGRGLTRLLLLVTLVLAATASSGSAAGKAGPHLLGVVPHRVTLHAFAQANPLAAASPAPGFLSFDAPYETLINQYFADVAHDSGGTANVYSVATQYYDNPGQVHVQYQSTFGGSYVDHNPLPANGCNDGVDPVCLTDFQLQNEIQNVLSATGWHGSLTNEFFLMTPVGVGSCGDASGTECSTDVFCAYHNAFTDSAGEPVIYANEPYEGQIGGCSGAGQGFPDDEDADTTINTISHEHIESITDPFGDAWLADDGTGNTPGDEIGDLCAYGYGTPISSVNGQPFNQVINGHDYSLQQEYSNADHGCVQELGGPHTSPTPPGKGPLVYQPTNGVVMHTNTTYAIYWLPTAGNTSQPAISGTPAAGQTLTSTTGSWNGTPSGYSFQWQRCSSSGTGCANIAGATNSTYTVTGADGGNSVRSTVSATNVNGASPYAASAVDVVVPVPAATAAPVVSGLAGVGKHFSTTNGSWNTTATFTYQWQRCAADGGSCAPIAGATSAVHALVSVDAGHVLKAIVTATNVAGTASATSAGSHEVVAVPKSTSAPRISGKAAVGHRLRAGHGKWTWTPTTFGYQWLRCSASGGRCMAIKKAMRATYKVVRNDAGHRLRLRVTATNAAGSRTATSSSSALTSTRR
jgi:hypothetical protein